MGVPSSTWRRATILPLLLAVFAFYAATLRLGQRWGDDGPQYILHARNIAEGRPYSDTGYIYNPDYPNLGPASYPPGLPLLLVPIWKIRGFDPYAIELLEVAAFVSGLAGVYALYRRKLGEWAALALVAVVGFSPQLWDRKESLGSDFVFLPFLFFTLRAIDRTCDGLRRWRQAVWIAVLMVATASVRSIGLILVPAWIACELWRTRGISRFVALGCSLATALWVGEAILLRSPGGTAELFRLHPQTVITNLSLYRKMLEAYWWAGTIPLLTGAVYAATLLAAAWAVFRRLGSLGIAEMFLFCYMGAMLFYLPHEDRFLDPVFPIYVALGIETAVSLAGKMPGRIRALAAVALIVIAGVDYAGHYEQLDWGPLSPGFSDESFQEVAEFVRTETGESELFLFRKPRALALLTGRRAATYAFEPGLGEFVRNLHPAYIIASNGPEDVFGSGKEFLDPYIQEHAANLAVAFKNWDFTVYRVVMSP